MTYFVMIIVGLFIVFIGGLPAILIGKYIYKKDKETKPKKIIVQLFIFGILAVVPVIILNGFYDFLFPNQSTAFAVLCKYIIGVGLIEEIFKFLPAYFVGIKSKYFNNVYDAIFYTTFSAVCFAGFENIFYVFKSITDGLVVAILRFFTAVPGHVAFGVLMGYFIGKAYRYKNNNDTKKFRLNMIYSIVVPVLFHGIFDFGLIYGVETLNIGIIAIALLLDISLIVLAFKKIKNISNHNQKISDKVLKRDSSGLKFILIGVALIFLMFGLTKIDILSNLNIYTINDKVSIKEDSINIKVDLYEEIMISSENFIKVNVTIENNSNSSTSLKLSNFKLMDNSGNYLERRNISSNEELSNVIDANQKVVVSLYFKKNEIINDASKYMLVYNSSKEYSIMFAEDIVDFLTE